MEYGDFIKWKTSRGWSATGKLIYVDDKNKKICVVADEPAFVPYGNTSEESRPRYFIRFSRIITINGEKYSESE